MVEVCPVKPLVTTFLPRIYDKLFAFCDKLKLLLTSLLEGKFGPTLPTEMTLFPCFGAFVPMLNRPPPF